MIRCPWCEIKGDLYDQRHFTRLASVAATTKGHTLYACEHCKSRLLLVSTRIMGSLVFRVVIGDTNAVLNSAVPEFEGGEGRVLTDEAMALLCRPPHTLDGRDVREYRAKGWLER